MSQKWIVTPWAGAVEHVIDTDQEPDLLADAALAAGEPDDDLDADWPNEYNRGDVIDGYALWRAEG